ncbi:hypothetical protein RX328_16655 [Bradyrhizobium sp. sBnM-33]|nr:hypothetical protein [Bradyrhizobium sp. sBnM-33]WOH53571.1 hypothetical protein RX328_16655 [Bradyrhizobium sp. sBnM-33]
MASTDDAFELVIYDDGLQFRLDLGQCRLGPVIARMAASDHRPSMSVGSDIYAEHSEEIAGESVRVVTRAKLNEITLCKAGAAGDEALAFVVDKTFTPKPTAYYRRCHIDAAANQALVGSFAASIQRGRVGSFGSLSGLNVGGGVLGTGATGCSSLRSFEQHSRDLFCRANVPSYLAGARSLKLQRKVIGTEDGCMSFGVPF